jgi:hypothetical protein
LPQLPKSNFYRLNASSGAHGIHPFQSDHPTVVDLLHSLSLFFSLLMAFLCLTGVISNSLSLIIFFGRASSRRRSINVGVLLHFQVPTLIAIANNLLQVLLCGLSLSDLFLCMLALPVFSLAQLQQLVPGCPVQQQHQSP